MSTCHNCEPLEGGSVVHISDPQQAYCEQCGDDASTCIEKIDTKCVYYHYNQPGIPSTLPNLGIPSNTDLETILEAIDALVQQNLNVKIVPIDTPTVNLTVSGQADHTIQADVISSTDTGNILQIRSSGLYVPNTSDGKASVNGSDASDYLVNQITGGSDGVLSVSVTDNGGLLTIVPTFNPDLLAGALCGSSVFEACVEGLETPLTTTDSDSIAFTTSGTSDHELTADIILSDASGNTLVILDDGLYASGSTGGAVTASNGLNHLSTDVELGGALTKHTTVSGSTLDLLWTPRTFNIGNNTAGHFGLTGVDMSGSKFLVANTYSQLPSVGVTQLYTGADVTISSGASLLSGRTVNSGYTRLNLSNTLNWTVGSGNPVAASLDVLQINPTSGTTLTLNPGTGIRAVSASAAITILKAVNSATTGIVTHVAGMEIYSPQQENTAGTYYPKITNYYGILIQDSREYLVIDNTVITNSYGIYQYGTNDKNEFYGEVRYHNGLTNASDARIKHELSEYTTGLDVIKQIRPIVYKYKSEYQANSRTFVGVKAQEVENILPYSVEQATNKDFDDFRYYDDKPLLYALVNAVKELTAKVEALEAQIAAK